MVSVRSDAGTLIEWRLSSIQVYKPKLKTTDQNLTIYHAVDVGDRVGR